MHDPSVQVFEVRVPIPAVAYKVSAKMHAQAVDRSMRWLSGITHCIADGGTTGDVLGLIEQQLDSVDALGADPEEDAVLYAAKERASAASSSPVGDRAAHLLDLLERMRDWCLDGEEQPAPDGTWTLLEAVNVALAAADRGEPTP